MGLVQLRLEAMVLNETILSNHKPQQGHSVLHRSAGVDCFPSSQRSPPGVAISSVEGIISGNSDLRMESVSLLIMPRWVERIFDVVSPPFQMQPRGKYDLLSKYHSSSLLDALDLCRSKSSAMHEKELNLILRTILDGNHSNTDIGHFI